MALELARLQAGPYNHRAVDPTPSIGAPPAVDVSELTVRYGSQTALAGVTLSVSPGTILGVIGPNGAGKTTLINCLTGLLEPTSGRLAVLGHSPSRDAGVKRRIGVMPDSLELFDQLSPREFLAFNGEMYGLSREVASTRAAELLRALDLGDFGYRLADGSTGMRKKVAFAAALIHQPDVVFLDEPFESVDPGGVATMKAWLRELRGQGRTIWLASHALDTIERVCDDVALLQQGRVAWRGAVSDGASVALSADGQRFATLDALYFHVIGGRADRPDWL